MKQVISHEGTHLAGPRGRPETDDDTAPRLRSAIGRLHRRLRPTKAGAEAALTPTRRSLLHTIETHGPLRLSELAAEEGINPTMLSRVVAELADAGLIDRITDPADKRAALVTASKKGRKLLERMRRERTDVLSVALDALTEQERRTLHRALPALEKLAETLKGPRK